MEEVTRGQEQTALAALATFARADEQEQQTALAFIRGVQLGRTIRDETEEKGA